MRRDGPVLQSHPAVAKALSDCRRALWSVAIFSGIVNLLMLAGPIYMLQIYDRVLGSRNVPTLVALSVLLVGAYAFQGLLDAIRGRIVVRVALLLDLDLSKSVHSAVLKIASQNRSAGEAHQPVRDLDQIRAFFAGAGPIAIVDLPWVPFFLAICFLIHPWLGLLAVAGGIALLIVTMLTERSSRMPSRDMSQQAGLRSSMVEADRRNSETVIALGMAETMAMRWTKVNAKYLAATGRSGEVASTYGSISKIFRMLIQSAILGFGAYLVIKQELTGGAMIAASIMVGRALAPIEIAIANWRSFLSARISVRRLSETLARLDTVRQHTALPAPVRSLDVENIFVTAPGAQKPTVSGVRIKLVAGEALGIIGPSGGGKSSLARSLVGVWPASAGSVRFDGASIDQWDPIALGRHVGFMSQSVELFDGTIAENIARMADQPDSERVIKAAQVAGAHDLILRLPSGYDTRLGDGGIAVSAGQRQRIALARALYGDPFLIVLDEPNSNLDQEGELALAQAIRDLKSRGSIVIVIAHRPSVLAVCDQVLLIADGLQQAYGPRDEVIRKLTAAAQPSPSPGGLNPMRDVSAGKQR